jgi:pyruvate ferredoxin oxidoreductase alpha subunit
VNRDSGWIQLYAGTIQEVYDLILCAYPIAEDGEVNLPALVSYDGFILSHASEPVHTLSQEETDGFIPAPGQPARAVLDPAAPLQFGEVLFPEWYPDFEYKKHTALTGSLETARRVFSDFGEIAGRRYAPVDAFDCDDAEIVLLGIGSMMQTARFTAAQLRASGQKVGVVNVRLYRPFPEEEVVAAVGDARAVLVLDRDIGYGSSGMVYQDVTRAFYHRERRPDILNFIVGLGGKDITPKTVKRCVELGREGYSGQAVFWPDARGPAEGIPYTEGLALGGVGATEGEAEQE